jgi:negative regulator of sigma E activity
VEQDGEVLIHWRKFHLIGNVINSVLKYQQFPYDSAEMQNEGTQVRNPSQ